MPNKNKDARRVINGTYGELWLNGELVGECHGCQVKESYTREKIPMCGQLLQCPKLTGIERTGSIKLHKMNSCMAILIKAEIDAGRDPRFQLISKLADPNAYGAERVSVTGVAFDDLTVADWEVNTIGKVECPFTFEEYEYLDMIGA